MNETRCGMGGLETGRSKLGLVCREGDVPTSSARRYAMAHSSYRPVSLYERSWQHM